jgi:hypothetical protein
LLGKKMFNFDQFIHIRIPGILGYFFAAGGEFVPVFEVVSLANRSTAAHYVMTVDRPRSSN